MIALVQILAVLGSVMLTQGTMWNDIRRTKSITNKMPKAAYDRMLDHSGMESYAERQLKYFLVPNASNEYDVPLHVVNSYIDEPTLKTEHSENYARLASHHPGGYYVHVTKFTGSDFYINNLRVDSSKTGFFRLQSTTSYDGIKINHLTPLNLHDNASEAYPSVNPNPNAWEFLQNIEYYRYGAYYNIRTGRNSKRMGE
uniref:Uncharacterized protein n=1 Tax=Glossina pallidipes TaxID=7398 RepID=A0A1B0A9R4_GLOPL